MKVLRQFFKVLVLVLVLTICGLGLDYLVCSEDRKNQKASSKNLSDPAQLETVSNSVYVIVLFVFLLIFCIYFARFFFCCYRKIAISDKL